MVGVAGGGHAEHGAQIEKERLRTGTLGEGVVLPLGDELGGGHDGGVWSGYDIVADFTPDPAQGGARPGGKALVTLDARR